MKDDNGNVRSGDSLFMDGAEIFAFTLDVVPRCVGDLLARAGKSLEEIDFFVFHQANRYMLEHLRKTLGIPAEKFIVELGHCGNTVSSTIPIALSGAHRQGRLKAGSTGMLVGFGVGYSWGAALIRWRG
jgi:3-oxoacyl-[acyl-carrier-protein] synthase-3